MPLPMQNDSSMYLDFERPIIELEEKIREVEELSQTNEMDFSEEITSHRKRLNEMILEVFAKLTPWQRVELSRHPLRPQTLDYVENICDDFIELAGDRNYGNDRSIVTGLANIGTERVMIIGQQKGRNTKEAIACNWGCPLPEGYRKARRKMELAERFGIPIVTFIDTKGAHPGIEAEERGQSLAIAENLEVMSDLKVPVICIVIGEGGSGGALGIGVGDHFAILEYAYYSVISPEGCAAILWKSEERKEDAAAALKMTAPELLKLGVVDEVITEPVGGAHRSPEEMSSILREFILSKLAELKKLSTDELIENRYASIRKRGTFREGDDLPLAPEPQKDDAK